MTRIEDLQARLAQALERIGSTVEGWEPPAPLEPEPAPEPVVEIQAPPEMEAELVRLREELDDEKTVNAQLEERVRVLAERDVPAAPALDPGLQEQVNAQRESLAALDSELQRLRRSSDALREVCEALRDANAKGLAEPHLINKALLAEMESLRAARAVDAAETQAVMDTLAPLLTQATEETA